MDHILRVCPRAREVWSLSKVDIQPAIPFKAWFKNKISDQSSKSHTPCNAIFIFTAWNIWLRRNAWVFSKTNVTSDVLIKKSTWAATEWFFTQNQPKVGKAPKTTTWKPPPLNHHKVNTDASFYANTKQATLSGVCRDHNAEWVEGFKMSTATNNAMEAEIYAILLALNWIKRKNWKETILSSDCLRAVLTILQDKVLNDISSEMITSCRELLQDLRGVKLVFEGRGSNKLADSVAKQAKGLSDGFNIFCTLSSPPPLMCNEIFLADKQNLITSISEGASEGALDEGHFVSELHGDVVL
ncbi:uncharacterized protein LOC104895613 [Beta vulgaris subsp. vulgaris]|uniref:uncharacterized protein LOC104895613 n=1 Tax=Beta vulgaris subsp. vulgaris TaxID=3555 RepID=UPI002036F277|nr:uncharacterized protein LOC104895613 [Beta vulgaris subsp. vulgaris]